MKHSGIFPVTILVFLFLSSGCRKEEKTVYAIGDTGPAGGLVFYLDGKGGGMEASPASVEWTANEWGCINTSIEGTATTLGSGKANTDSIVKGCSAENIAAALCRDLVFNGYDDWFLPSKDELDLVRTNLYQKDIGGFDGYRYWSSSQENTNTAWWEDFASGNKAANSKPNTYFVRAVRAF